MFRNQKPARSNGEPEDGEEEAEALRACARRLLDAATDEPVPERLRRLALALEEALTHRRSVAPAPAPEDIPKTK